MASSSASSDLTATANAIAAKYVNKCEELKLHKLPKDVIDKILLELAQVKYDDISRLADIYHDMETFCTDFMKRHPRSQFLPTRPAGLSDSEDEEENNGCGIDWDHFDPDDLDELNDMLERFSYGSNYDEDVDEFLNGPDYANYDEAYGGEEDSSNVAGDQAPTYEVTEGW